jgi:uncharacterized membrane protein YdjX (TVP38/TMEM64 family)
VRAEKSTGSKRAEAVAKAALAVALMLALGWGLLEMLDALGGAAGVRREFGAASLLLLLPMFAAPAVPGELATLTTVAIYGFALGAALSWAALIMRAWVEYGLAHSLAAGEGAAADRLPPWIRRFPAGHPVFLVAGRWMPLGNHIVSVAAGLHGVAPWRFTWTSALGLVPFVLLVSGATAGLAAWHD